MLCYVLLYQSLLNADPDILRWQKCDISKPTQQNSNDSSRHWGLVTHICVHEIGHVINGSGDSLLPVRRYVITWIKLELSSSGPFGTNINEMLIKNVVGKCLPYISGLNMLTVIKKTDRLLTFLDQLADTMLGAKWIANSRLFSCQIIPGNYALHRERSCFFKPTCPMVYYDKKCYRPHRAMFVQVCIW